MKRIFLTLCCVAALLLTACKPNRNQLQEQITEMEGRLFASLVMSENETADSLVALYAQYVDAFPKDSLAPIYLFRSADVLINMNRTDEAEDQLDRMIEEYPDFEEIAMCYFQKGFAYEQNQQYDLAKEAYSEFVSKFPNHYLANDTRKMLPYIGLSPEEMLDVVMQEADTTVVPAVTEK